MRYLVDHPLQAESLFRALPGATALVDAEGVIADANQRLGDLTDYALDELVGREAQSLVVRDERAGLLERLRRTLADPADATPWSLTLLRRDGRQVAVTAAASRLSWGDDSGVLVEFVVPAPRQGGGAHDGDDAQVLAASLAESEQRFRLAFEGSMAPMVFSDRHGGFLAVNAAYCAMTGLSAPDLIGRDSKHFTYPEDVGLSEEAYRMISSGEVDEYRYHKRFLHTSGRIVAAEVSIRCGRDDSGQAEYFVSSVRDVTEEKALAAQLSFQALHDPLTGLANRALFDDRLVQARARAAAREGYQGAVFLIDLDDFTGVNDSYGHLVGDQLLIEIANRLRRVTRSTDTLSRFGGDEFLYLAEGLTSTDEALHIARRLMATLENPFTFHQVTLHQQASAGVVVWSGESPDNVELVQNADAAMYEAKSQGHGHVALYTPEIGLKAVSRFSLVQELRHALSSGQVMMHYQPIVDLASSEVVGFEALMRWHHPAQGWIPPDVFIPLAEQSDLILELGAFALREALSAAASWEVTDRSAGFPCVTVNFSARQFHDPGLVALIEGELSRSGVAPERLVLEVTERVALVDIAETMSIMDELNRLRVGIALDDFGTGYSSLSYLAALNPRIIKIDQSFVRPQHDKKRSDTLLEAIVTLGNKLNMTVLAEGIETSAQLERLHHLECDLGQGFLWSPAVPAAEASNMLVTGDET